MGGATVSVRLFCLYVGHMWRRRHAHVENTYAANSATGTTRSSHELLRVFVYGRWPLGGTLGGIASRCFWATAGHNDLCRLHGLVGIDYGRNEPSLGQLRRANGRVGMMFFLRMALYADIKKASILLTFSARKKEQRY